MKILFPNLYDARYWDVHYKYIYELFQAMNWQISLKDGTVNYFISNDRTEKYPMEFAIDFGDSPELQPSLVPTFKFHTTQITRDACFPFPPISFYDWKRFQQLQSSITYYAEGPISSRQWPHHAAETRRADLQTLLRNNFPDVLTSIIDQISFWNEVSKILVYVHCPGYSNHILDRAQLQYMALGCATISPYLPEILPFDFTPKPGIHYIMCKEDFSDVPFLIKTTSKEILLWIGNNAKQLFNRTCTPKAVALWMQACLGLHE
jgi:hypothetical protein